MHTTPFAPTFDPTYLSPSQTLRMRQRLRDTLLRQHGAWLRAPLDAVLRRHLTRLHGGRPDVERAVAAFNDDLLQLAKVVVLTANNAGECYPHATRRALGDIVLAGVAAQLNGKPAPWEETAA